MMSYNMDPESMLTQSTQTGLPIPTPPEHGMPRPSVLLGGALIAVGALSLIVAWDSNTGNMPSQVAPTEVTTSPMINNEILLGTSPDKQFQRLASYEQHLSPEAKVDSMMLFTSMPTNEAEAQSMAASMATTLHEWNKCGIKPLVVMEPTKVMADGITQNIDLTTFGADSPNVQATQSYFEALKQAGISNELIGTWVLFPEPNDPGWENNVTDPNLFARNVTTIANVLKNTFPDAQASIMLDSQTATKADWSNSTMDPNALLPYVRAFSNAQGYKPGLIDSFGLQGFPWNNNANTNTYLSSDGAIQAGRILGVRDIWLNTGAFHKVIDPNGSPTVTITATDADRADFLKGGLAAAKAIKAAGYNVKLNIYSGDDYDGTSGKADWSYTTPADYASLNTCLTDAEKAGVDVSLFLDPAS